MLDTTATVTVNPLSSAWPPAAAPLSASTATGPKVQSLAPLSPHLHCFLCLVIGSYDSPELPVCTWHTLLWLAICLNGFLAFGIGVGPCEGGWSTNLGVGFLYLVAFACFLLLRANVRAVFADLGPTLRLMVDLEHNAGERLERDRLRTRNEVAALAVTFPATVLAIWACFTPAMTERQRVQGFSGDCSDRSFLGTHITFLSFFCVVFIAAAQMALLFAIARIYVFRLRILMAMLVQMDMAAAAAELSGHTPWAERKLLAEPPHSKAGAGAREHTPYIFRTLAAPRRVEPGPESSAAGVGGAADQALRIYTAIREEASRHASVWSAPIIVFGVAYLFLFALTLVSIIRDIVQSKSQPVSVAVVYLFLALAYITVNLVPIITINSAWSRLLAKPELSLRAWPSEDRLLLTTHFSHNPMLFPILGLTFDWKKVLVLLSTAVSPLLLKAAAAVVSAPSSSSDLGSAGNATAVL